MMRNVARALIATVVLALVTGLGYPLVMTGVGQLLFHKTAEGSIVTVGGKAVGSAHIGQKWEGPEWFYGRPSAVDYDASTSSGSNLGPTSKKLADQITARAEAIMKVEGPYVSGLTVGRIPADLLLASASGLDPDISPEAALFQAPRIAAVRHMTLQAVRTLIERYTHEPPFRLFGGPHVNVLQLNLALASAA
jgi:potassium-transporting ATPase KdpC subunit